MDLVYNIYNEMVGEKRKCSKCGAEYEHFWGYASRNPGSEQHHCPPKPKIVEKKQTHNPIVRDFPLSDLNDVWDL